MALKSIWRIYLNNILTVIQLIKIFHPIYKTVTVYYNGEYSILTWYVLSKLSYINLVMRDVLPTENNDTTIYIHYLNNVKDLIIFTDILSCRNVLLVLVYRYYSNMCMSLLKYLRSSSTHGQQKTYSIRHYKNPIIKGPNGFSLLELNGCCIQQMQDKLHPPTHSCSK